ncbi:hypothetical protein M011DRAFT_493291 [Sporormia fimetaria CBS 119925]|uniref:Sm domain-containing protein n=1 Tax=Sporormia fimetaria CBS 119925 TaxID=1340428 RepID=A0A6A6VIP5_9PLEO|nr:hypothetical protein M011DRAFT_493291 [Sporormia fimetaria CBS 119925]
MSFPNQPHSGPAGPSNMAPGFNAMGQRPAQGPPPQEPARAHTGQTGPPMPPSPLPQTQLGGGRPPAPQTILPGDLPPQAFLTSSMLLDMVDKKVAVLLRDEKEFIGILRSYDQYANLALTECFERVAARNPEAASNPSAPKWLACDVPCHGLMTIRGENVTICATIDLDREDEPAGLEFVDQETVRKLLAEQQAEKATVEAKKTKALKRAGLEITPSQW